MLKNYDRDQITSLAYTGSLLQGTAHNLNTPLSSILGRADILRLRLDRILERVSDPVVLQELEKCRRDIALIIENSNRVTSIVKSAVHRCAVSIQNESRPINIGCLLRDDLDFFQSDMEFKHNIEKRINIDISVPAITGAHVHFSNSFAELLINAQTAMIENEIKILTVSVQSEGGSVVVAIGDNGRGMDEQTRLGALYTLEHPPSSVAGPLSGLARVAYMLQPYNPRFKVESCAGTTLITVVFPV